MPSLTAYLSKEKLKLADLDYDPKAGTDLILGADVFVRIMEWIIRKRNPLMVLAGKISATTLVPNKSMAEFHTVLQRFFKTEVAPNNVQSSTSQKEGTLHIASYGRLHKSVARVVGLVKLLQCSLR